MPRVTITVPEQNSQPYRFQLDTELVTLGRGSGNDIAIESSSVSVHHAEMRRVKGGYELCDCGSTNGIKLDDVRHQTIPLHHGIIVNIGDVPLELFLTDEELATLELEQTAKPSGIIKEPEIVIDRSSLPAKRKVAAIAGQPSGGGFLWIVIFLILAAIAFFVGLEIRHQKETGNSLIDAIKVKSTTPK